MTIIDALIESTSHLARLSKVDAAAAEVYKNNIRVIKEHYFCDVKERVNFATSELYGVDIIIHCVK